ncbi:MAG: hypothetical protein BZY88_18520 [SAR202 cluster bacterium Io17-Chloro-G9]|nr:MAG: hypothetical protein BZY88_18520 [SAR202 cluster bacterium Io17-Chloro-G9]
MAVTALDIKTRQPFAQGVGFGSTGAYEQLDGVVHFSVNSSHPANDAITDLKLAPRDADSRVSFTSDFRILKPVSPQRGNRRLLLDVLNRGNPLALGMFNAAPAAASPAEPQQPGNGFLMRQGYTVAWCGWQHDVPQVPGLLGIRVPEALGADGPLSGRIAVTFQSPAPVQVQMLSDRMHRPYPSNNLESWDDVLTVQDHEGAPSQLIPRDQWSFARLEEGRVTPDATHIYLSSGFQTGKVYRLIYSTSGAPVVGLGLLATRDLVSFLRFGSGSGDNPCQGDVDFAYGFGASQSGRYLRQFLHLALNQDEEDRTVFDGLIPHIAGARRGEFNQRFGQPSSAGLLSTSNLFPFADTEQTDPETGRADGLLSRLAARGKVPKIFLTNSSCEYWRGDASLIHTGLEGEKDLSPSEPVRIFYFAGTQHGSGTFPPADTSPARGLRGQQQFNWVDYRPLLRSALVNLDRWVTSGEPPPPSRHPRVDDGTAIPAERVAGFFQSIPGVNFPEHPSHVSRLDFGPVEGIASQIPPAVGKPYVSLVSAVDQDGNELGGILLPDLTTPLGTHTGWNLRHADIGGTGQTLGLWGSTLPFPVTKSQGDASGDPRRSLEERYISKEDYLGRVRKAAQNLVDDRYLLAEDIYPVVDQAAQRYDLLHRQVPQHQAADA